MGIRVKIGRYVADIEPTWWDRHQAALTLLIVLAALGAAASASVLVILPGSGTSLLAQQLPAAEARASAESSNGAREPGTGSGGGAPSRQLAGAGGDYVAMACSGEWYDGRSLPDLDGLAISSIEPAETRLTPLQAAIRLLEAYGPIDPAVVDGIDPQILLLIDIKTVQRLDPRTAERLKARVAALKRLKEHSR
jgi:hypothetical protein